MLFRSLGSARVSVHDAALATSLHALSHSLLPAHGDQQQLLAAAADGGGVFIAAETQQVAAEAELMNT